MFRKDDEYYSAMKAIDKLKDQLIDLKANELWNEDDTNPFAANYSYSEEEDLEELDIILKLQDAIDQKSKSLDLSNKNLHMLDAGNLELIYKILLHSKTESLDLSSNHLSSMDPEPFKVLLKIIEIPTLNELSLEDNNLSSLSTRDIIFLCKSLEHSHCYSLSLDMQFARHSHQWNTLTFALIENRLIRELYDVPDEFLEKMHDHLTNNKTLHLILEDGTKLKTQLDEHFFSTSIILESDLINAVNKFKETGDHHELVNACNPILNYLNKIKKEHDLFEVTDQLNAALEKYKTDGDRESLAHTTMTLLQQPLNEVVDEFSTKDILDSYLIEIDEALDNFNHARNDLLDPEQPQSQLFLAKIKILKDDICWLAGKLSFDYAELPEALAYWQKISSSNTNKRFDAFEYCYNNLTNQGNDQWNSFITALGCCLNQENQLILFRGQRNAVFNQLLLDVAGFTNKQARVSKENQLILLKHLILKNTTISDTPTFFKKPVDACKTIEDLNSNIENINKKWSSLMSTTLDEDLRPLCSAIDSIPVNKKRQREEASIVEEQPEAKRPRKK